MSWEEIAIIALVLLLFFGCWTLLGLAVMLANIFNPRAEDPTPWERFFMGPLAWIELILEWRKRL